MNSLVKEMALRASTLPEQAQQEALDFVEFLQNKFSKKSLNPIHETALATDWHRTEESEAWEKQQEKNVSPIYQAFEQAGLIGCIETDEQLSTTYKEKLDFSFIHGA